MKDLEFFNRIHPEAAAQTRPNLTLFVRSSADYYT